MPMIEIPYSEYTSLSISQEYRYLDDLKALLK
jgi:hypothetical protein